MQQKLLQATGYIRMPVHMQKNEGKKSAQKITITCRNPITK